MTRVLLGTFIVAHGLLTAFIPWLLAGKCGGYFNLGQCPPSAGKPLNGVMTDIVRACGVAESPFGETWPGLRKA